MRSFLIIIISLLFVNKSYSQEINNLTPKPELQNNKSKQDTVQEKKWIKPAEGKISNPFGNNYNFYGHYRAGHTGIDIENKVGSIIYSVDDGFVKFIKTKSNMRYGYYMVIQHKKDLYTLYGHLSRFFVKEGEKVKKGQKIALMGESGLASFPHLHFEVLNKFPINDGAWGYNYICKQRKEKDIKIAKSKKDTPESDFLTVNEITDKYGFLDKEEKKISYIYRMIEKKCLPKKIIEITYYNPEILLPPYEKSKLKSFKYIPKPKITPSPSPSPTPTPIISPLPNKTNKELEISKTKSYPLNQQ